MVAVKQEHPQLGKRHHNFVAASVVSVSGRSGTAGAALQPVIPAVVEDKGGSQATGQQHASVPTPAHSSGTPLRAQDSHVAGAHTGDTKHVGGWLRGDGETNTEGQRAAGLVPKRLHVHRQGRHVIEGHIQPAGVHTARAPMSNGRDS